MGKRKKQYDLDALTADPDIYGRPLTEAELDDLFDVELEVPTDEEITANFKEANRLLDDLPDLPDPVDDLDDLGDPEVLDALAGSFDDFLAANAY